MEQANSSCELITRAERANSYCELTTTRVKKLQAIPQTESETVTEERHPTEFQGDEVLYRIGFSRLKADRSAGSYVRSSRSEDDDKIWNRFLDVTVAETEASERTEMYSCDHFDAGDDLGDDENDEVQGPLDANGDEMSEEEERGAADGGDGDDAGGADGDDPTEAVVDADDAADSDKEVDEREAEE